MRSIVYVSLFVACWFAAIDAFRSSLLFRLLDIVPSQVRFVVDRLLCFLIVGIQASEISIPLSLLMLLGWSYIDSLFDPTCVSVRVTIIITISLTSFQIGRCLVSLACSETAEICVRAAVYLCRVLLSFLASLSLFSRCILCRTHMEFCR